MPNKKKKKVSPFETIQILKTDRAKLFELAMQIKEANGEQSYGFGDKRTSLPCPATMVGYAVDALSIISKPTTTITKRGELN